MTDRSGENVLLSCVGRRCYLGQWFREALGGSGLVVATDADPTAPGLQVADHAVVVPRVTDPAYLGTVLELCRHFKVALVVSLNDLELPMLASARDVFAAQGTHVLGADRLGVEACLDKLATQDLAASLELRYPTTFRDRASARSWWRDRGYVGKMVVKPRWGTGSIGVEIVESGAELDAAWDLCEARVSRSIVGSMSVGERGEWVIGQQCVAGAEYGLDVVNDLGGRFVCGFGRRKIAMRAGETDKAVVVVRQELDRIASLLGQSIGHSGLVDCDLIEDETGFVLLEINPRFGGGYPFSHLAGADIPRAFVAWMRGGTPEPQWLQVRPGVVGAKADHVVEITARHDACTVEP